jgi:predicted phage baseplate assembly protein
MPLPTPELDNRRFADIVAEARALVPRYTPEWTDLNESDPGMTFVQLYAWMTEMVLYRLNQVPALNYVKFLELIGVRLQPAQAARAELTFTPVDPPTTPVTIVPRGTRVAAAAADGGPPVVFETDEALQALGPTLAAVLSYDGFSYTQLTSTNAAGNQGFDPFGPRARDDSALVLGFDFAGDFPRVQVNLMVRVSATNPPPDGVHCDLSEDEIAPPAQLVWEYWDGGVWALLALDKDETRAFSRSGHVYLQVPELRLKKLVLADLADPLYWLRARVTRSTYDRAPRLDAVLLNTVAATQAQTVTNEVLGGSDGMPNQVFQVFSTPVLPGTLVLEIDEGDGFRSWREVEDFFAAGADELVYTLDAATGTISLGDNEHGHLAVANPGNAGANVVARTYRFGGGKAGAVPAGAITQLQSAVDGIERVTNLRPAEGGRDEESLDDAGTRAPRELKTGSRAVTAEDFETIARLTPGATIRRAIARPLVHPSFLDVQIPGTVTVVVVPDTADDIPNPMPSEATLRTVCAHLNKHRLVTTEVYVVGPRYQKLKVAANVLVRGSADLGLVRAAIDQALTRYFHPLQGGEDGLGWPLGGEIFYSLVYRTVLEADPAGVARIGELFIWLDDEEQPFCRDVPIQPDALLYSDIHDIQVSYV